MNLFPERRSGVYDARLQEYCYVHEESQELEQRSHKLRCFEMEIIFSNILQARRLFDEQPRSDQQREGVHNETETRRKFEIREKAAAAGGDRGRREEGGRGRKRVPILRGREAERTERHCV